MYCSYVYLGVPTQRKGVVMGSGFDESFQLTMIKRWERIVYEPSAVLVLGLESK